MKVYIALLAVLLQGSIQAESKPRPCPRACSFLYKPVCGSNGETYANNCLLKAARDCQNLAELYAVKNGDCDDCTSPSVTGFCRAYLPRWHYDTESDTCKQFVFGGCGGNGNNYATKEACEKTCVKNKVCPDRCPNTYDPICGSDGRTYSNKCQLQMVVGCWKEKIAIVYSGECSSNKGKNKEVCPERCPNTYDPICGSDGRTYSNRCQLQMAVGCWKEKITYLYSGECVSNEGPKY